MCVCVGGGGGGGGLETKLAGILTQVWVLACA